MLDSIDAVSEMIDGIDFGGYRLDLKTRRAVERCIEIISEASRSISEPSKARHPEISWPDVAGIGNLLRHEYQRVDDHIVWSAATRSLPQLRTVVLKLLNESARAGD